MKKLAIFTAVAALALSLTAGTAYAFKGEAFESPFVATDGIEVSGSEGKVGVLGQFKVEIDTATPDTIYNICIVNGVVEAFLAQATTDEDGELKATGGNGSVPTSTDYEEFAFRVRDADDSECTGTLRWASGFSL